MKARQPPAAKYLWYSEMPIPAGAQVFPKFWPESANFGQPFAGARVNAGRPGLSSTNS